MGGPASRIARRRQFFHDLLFQRAAWLILKLRASVLSLVKRAEVASLVKRISQRVPRHRVPRLSRQTGTHCILEQWVPRKRRTTRYERRLTLEACGFREHRGLARLPAPIFPSRAGLPIQLLLVWKDRNFSICGFFGW